MKLVYVCLLLVIASCALKKQGLFYSNYTNGKDLSEFDGFEVSQRMNYKIIRREVDGKIYKLIIYEIDNEYSLGNNSSQFSKMILENHLDSSSEFSRLEHLAERYDDLKALYIDGIAKNNKGTVRVYFSKRDLIVSFPQRYSEQDVSNYFKEQNFVKSGNYYYCRAKNDFKYYH